MSRGLAGAAVFAVPVAVAALIGFGTSLSGVAGGLTAFTSGPDAVPASAQATPSKLNHAVVALANRPAQAQPNSGGDSGQAGGDGVSVQGTPTPSGGSGTTNTNIDATPAGTNTTTTATPGASLPDTSQITDTTTTTTDSAVTQVGGAVNTLLGGVSQTLNNLLNGGQ